MSNLKEARRALGAEWLKNHPKMLERAYVWSKSLIRKSYPTLQKIAPRWADGWMVRSEEVLKGWAFNCQMCGQCVLHSTGMTCPMNCPKNLRNGPCGGVRQNGNCEVVPDMPCVWVQAFERSQQMVIFADDIQVIQPPLNRTLQNTSAWVNMLDGKDAQTPKGWR